MKCKFMILAAIFAVAAYSQTTVGRVAAENEREAKANASWPPQKIIDIAGLKAGMTVAEIGAGRGRNIVYMAEKVGSSGRVYAEDIDIDGLRHIADRCRRIGFTNVKTIAGGAAEPQLPAGSMDIIFIIGSYQHFTDAVTLMRNARTALKAGGRVAIADFFSEADTAESVTEKTMLAQMEKAGFILDRIDKSLEKNRLIIYLFGLR